MTFESVSYASVGASPCTLSTCRAPPRSTTAKTLYPKIFEANRDQLADPNKIKPGQELRFRDSRRSKLKE